MFFPNMPYTLHKLQTNGRFEVLTVVLLWIHENVVGCLALGNKGTVFL